MNTKVVTVDKKNPDNEALQEAGEILKRGGLVAFPTETVYGLGGDGLNPDSSRKIYAAKGRPSDNPLIIHIADMDSLGKLVTQVPGKARKLAERFWPGPLTMIFQKSREVPYETTGGLESVAVRMPSHPVALALIRAGGGYVAAPSANTSGRPSPTKAEHVVEDLQGKIEMIVDGGDVGIGLESTIVDFTEEIPVILRPGYVNQSMIEEVIGPVRMDKGLLITDEKVKPKAPGMKYRHYAPKAELTVIEGELESVVSTIQKMAGEKEEQGYRTGIIATEETVNRYSGSNIKCIGTREDESTVAANLYGILREFDADGTDYIYSESFDAEGIGSAVMNRLLKAAGHRVIKI